MYKQTEAFKTFAVPNSTPPTPSALTTWIKTEALALGFSACGIARPDTRDQIAHLERYLAQGFEGQMTFLHNHHDKRADPAALVDGTKSIVCVRMDYLAAPVVTRTVADSKQPNQAIVARYARGRDYHKTMRGRLKTLAQRIENQFRSEFVWRPFADSAPIFEKALAENAGLGWTGKHTLLIDKTAGSFFVLGELFTSLELVFDEPMRASNRIATTPPDAPTSHCGSCTACIDICPTRAIVAPFELDARRCIAYLTIEHKGAIPHEFRRAIGNRVFGCDDCQLICPWNRFAKLTQVSDFEPRHGLDSLSLLELFAWSESEFDKHTQGSPLRRTGFDGLMRNVAIGLGNAPASHTIIAALEAKKPLVNDMVNEHISWAIDEQQHKMRSKCIYDEI